MSRSTLAHEKVWVDKKIYADAERQYYESQAKLRVSGIPVITPFPVPSNLPVVTAVHKKNKQKNMAPPQNIVADNSPKKNKRKNHKKNRNVSASEKEVDNKVINDIEKEVCVEKSVCGEEKDKLMSIVTTEVVEKDETIPLLSGQAEEKEKAIPVITSLAGEKDKTTVEKDNISVEKQITPPKVIRGSPEIKLIQKQSKNNENIKIAEMESNKPTVIENVKVDKTEQGGAGQSSLAGEVAKARQLLKNSLQCMDSVAALASSPNVEVMNTINSLKQENKELKKTVEELQKSFQQLKLNFDTFTAKFSSQATAPVASKAAAPAPAAPAKDDSDDGVDLFGSDDEEESAEAARVREERLAAYNAKKSKKPVLIAKSNIILDVKPWDDETDMSAMEAAVRTVAADGLLWGAAKLVPLAYGIHKLQISCVVEDDKVSVDWLTEELEKIEDYVQSVDIAAFNKV